MKNIFEENFNRQKNKINKILDFAYNNKYSYFYKNKYKKLPKVNSYKDFQEVPFLEKSELLNTDLENFTFTSQNKIIRYMFSSGTTGKPLITAHNAPSPPIPGRTALLKKLNIKKVLFLFPINIQNDRVPTLTNNIVGISGDIYNLPLMAHLLSETNLNGISSTPTILEFFIEELKKIKDFDFKNIKWIELAGEFCTKQKMHYFKSIFPNAYFDHIWGATETGGHKGYRCRHMKNLPANNFHLFNDHHLY